MKRILFLLAVAGLFVTYALVRSGPSPYVSMASEGLSSGRGGKRVIEGRADTTWGERVAPFASGCTASSPDDQKISGSKQRGDRASGPQDFPPSGREGARQSEAQSALPSERKDTLALNGPAHDWSTIPPAAPDPAFLDALAGEPLAQEALRRIAEANEEVLYNPLPDWPLADEDFLPPGSPHISAKSVYVIDHDSGQVLLAKRANTPYPIASIAKLMGTIIYADTDSDPNEVLTLLWEDKYIPMVTHSKLRVGGFYRAGDLLYQTLLSSDNRAMMALTRQTQLPLEVFRDAMNARAETLGLSHTYFEEPTGIDPRDVSTAREVALLLEAALAHPVLHPVLTTKRHYYLRLDKHVRIGAHATNRLAHEPSWDVIASKTGYTIMSGSCLVMKTRLHDGRLVTISILGARGIDGRYPVAAAIRRYLESSP